MRSIKKIKNDIDSCQRKLKELETELFRATADDRITYINKGLADGVNYYYLQGTVIVPIKEVVSLDESYHPENQMDLYTNGFKVFVKDYTNKVASIFYDVIMRREKISKMKDIRIGDRYYYPSDSEKIYTVKKIMNNPKAGEPIKDMFGGTVYRESAGTIFGVSDGDLDELTAQNWDDEITRVCFL